MDIGPRAIEPTTDEQEGAQVVLRATGVATGGDAVARHSSGRVVLVHGALPGETVRAQMTGLRARYARADVVEVLVPSPHRVVPPCPHVERGCGGCGWQHVALDAQRQLKAQLVTESLQRLGGIADPQVKVGPAQDLEGYRTTVRLAVRAGRPGLYRRHSHDVVDLDSCLVAHPLLADLIAEAELGLATEVTFRCGARTGQRLAVLSPRTDGARLPGDVRAIGLDELSAGRRAWIFEEVAGARLRVSALSFFQAGADGAEALVADVGRAVEGAGPGRLVDAYGGVGLFAATVGAGRPVTVLETSASAAADARTNLPAARVAIVDVGRWLPRPASVVVADPPRVGLGPRAASVLAATGASHLALVSCDPASLGRDAGLLAEHGFELEWASVVDTFPGTPHIETVSRFTR